MKTEKKPTKVKHNERSNKQKRLSRQIQKLLEEKGMETFQKVKKVILEERLECRELCDALKHFLSYKSSGFLVRPALLSLGCEAVGGDSKIISDVAVPLVLMSGGIDIHDDIIDGSRTQDSSLTVLGKFNKDIALLTGDALLFKGLIMWHKLAQKRLSVKKFIDLSKILEEAFSELGDGQALELGLRGKTGIEPERYISIVKKKAADIAALLHIGAILGNAPSRGIEDLINYGRCLGMLWVLNDDLIDMYDYKEMKRRAENGCLPLPVLYALRSPEFKSQIREILLKKKMTRRDAEVAFQLVADGRGLERTKKVMQSLASQAYTRTGRFMNSEWLKLLIGDAMGLVSQM